MMLEDQLCQIFYKSEKVEDNSRKMEIMNEEIEKLTDIKNDQKIEIDENFKRF